MLCVSQFTLYHVMKVIGKPLPYQPTWIILYPVFRQGNKPDFHLAMGGEESKLLYEQLLAGLRKGYKEDKIQTGVFGAMMQVGAFDLVHH